MYADDEILLSSSAKGLQHKLTIQHINTTIIGVLVSMHQKQR
jgi:hypothetical protein